MAKKKKYRLVKKHGVEDGKIYEYYVVQSWWQSWFGFSGVWFDHIGTSGKYRTLDDIKNKLLEECQEHEARVFLEVMSEEFETLAALYKSLL